MSLSAFLDELFTNAVNVHGGSGDINRGTWCTPKWLAQLMGRYDLDPCSNPRSHILCDERWMLEKGDNGLLPKWVHAIITDPGHRGLRAFINPPYSKGQVIEWVNAYCHTDFTFLLRWDPSTAWFHSLIQHTRYVWFPLGRRINFEPPPGVKASSSTMPHALYLRNEPNAALQAAGLVLTIPEIHRMTGRV